MRKAIVGTNYLAYKVIYQAAGNWEIAFFTNEQTAEAFCKMVNGKTLKTPWRVNTYIPIDEWRLME